MGAVAEKTGKCREHDVAATLTADMAAIGLTPHAEQIAMATMLQEVHDEGGAMVGFVEAPTATGKTLVMAQHALRNAAKTGETHVVAAPTVEICHQTMTAITLLQAGVADLAGPTVRIVLGRQEFVSQEGANDFAAALDEAGNATGAETVRAWHAAGGPGPTGSHAAYTRKGLEAALAAAGADVPVPDWADLTHAGPEDPANAAHAEQFEPADVLIVTHAMLSRDLIKRYVTASKLRKAAGVTANPRGEGWRREAARQRLEFEAEAEGRLPEYRRLLVDEAHLLRANVEAALTTSVSLRQLAASVDEVARTAGGPRVPATVHARLTTAQQALSSHRMMSRGGSIRINWLDDLGIGDILEEVKEALDQVRLPKTPVGRAQHEIARARYALRESLGARNGVRTTVEWSPSRSYPSIAVGPRGLGAEMGFLWGRLTSACAVSATLYTENRDGSAVKYMAERLGVAPDGRTAFEPIRASWTTEAVTVHTPGATNAMLTPVRDEASPAHAAWMTSLAMAIAYAQEDETRGTLVLTTSRALTASIRNALVEQGDVDPSRIIDGTLGRMGGNRSAFEAAARAGMRPVWIAQGPAWTGLDLDDATIGTLVVAKLPFPPPRPGDTKGSEPSYDGEQVARMMMTLKQGLGRLVRSRNPAPKRAFVLDGRIDGTGAARAANGLLDRYRRERL